MANLPNGLKGAFFGTIALSVTFGCCALYSGTSVISQLLLERHLGGAGLTESPEMGPLLAMQRAGEIAAVIDLLLQLTAGFALAVGGAIGLTGKPLGRTLALGGLAVSALVIAAQFALNLWMWSQTQALMSSLGGGMGAEEARFSGAIGMLAIAPGACWQLFRLAIVGACATAMLTPESRAFYGTVGDAGLRAGPRD